MEILSEVLTTHQDNAEVSKDVSLALKNLGVIPTEGKDNCTVC